MWFDGIDDIHKIPILRHFFEIVKLKNYSILYPTSDKLVTKNNPLRMACRGLYHFNGLFQFFNAFMGIDTCCKGTGCVADKAVNTYLIHSGAVQKRSEGVPAVVWRMVCKYSDILEGFLEQLRICGGCDRLAI